MTKALDCDTYLSNKGSENYVDIDMFVKNGLNHQYLNYKDVEYHQCFKSHLPYLSILDMLFNLGSEQTYDIISDKANYDFSELNQRLGE